MSRKANKTVLSVALISAILTLSSFAQQPAVNDEQGSKFCTYSKRMPIIPDGNIATKDELIDAKERIALYQDQLANYRECLYQVEKNLDTTADDYEERKVAIQKLSDESIEVEQKVADKFNQAIRIYKDR
ncbi:MAG: hypothetical protein MK188_06705 [Gammaproteobacteria bacterium]|nr:hypothetical protein [Gammaproteobacteria bacterium]